MHLGIAERELHELIRLTYTTVGDPDVWPLVLGHLRTHFRGEKANLHAQDIRTRAMPLAMVDRWTAEELESYTSYYVHRDAFALGAVRRQQPGDIGTDDTLLTDEEFRRNEFVNDLLVPNGCGRVIGIFLKRSPDTAFLLAIHRPLAAGRFSETDRNLMRVMTPHLQGAFALGNRMRDIVTQRDDLTEVVDALPYGVFFADYRCRVVGANVTARALAAENGPVRLTLGELRVGTGAREAAFQKLVSAAAFTAREQGFAPGGSMRVACAEPGRWLDILVAPVHTRSSKIRGAGAVVLLFDSARRAASIHEIVKQLFGLTNAEATVAERLLNGATVTEMCDELRVGLPTVKTHLKRIMSKTGAKRQADLIRLLLRGPAALR